MTLQQLQYVLALNTHHHFVKAAEACSVAQPTLTLQVKKLEREIGFEIFNRQSKPLTPTPMGEKFIERTQRIMREVDGLKDLVNQDKHELKGHFRVGVIPTLAPYLLPRFLQKFMAEHPDVSLEIKEIQSEVIIKKLHDNSLDIGLLATPVQEKGLREIHLFYEPFKVYAHQNDPILNQDELLAKKLSEKGLWLLEQGHCFRNQVLNICGQSSKRKKEQIAFDSGSIETLKNMIKSQTGYTLIPELAIADTDTTCVRTFNEPQPVRQISLLVHHRFTKELLLQHLKDSIVQSVPEHFDKNLKKQLIKWR